jgi:N-acetylglutamate synthase-like GNAT family acetyltransferase
MTFGQIHTKIHCNQSAADKDIRCKEVLLFIDAEAKHLELLRDTLIASKGYWGYSQEQLEQWRSNLNFKEEYVTRNTVRLILEDASVIGFFALVKSGINELDHFWLLPKAIGKGNGNLVFKQILLECKALNIADFYIISDPDAEGFYLKKGAVKVGEVYSEPQKRMLPRLKYSLV